MEPVANKLPLVFTLPYSSEEILLFSFDARPSLGVIYQPLKMDAPAPWQADCPHCLRGLQAGLDINIKRAVQVLCTRRLDKDVEEYQIPTNKEPCAVLCKRDDKGLIVKVSQPHREPIDAIWTGRSFISQGNPILLKSKIVDRSLKLLGSVRSTSKREAIACLMPLLAKQKIEGIAIRRRASCLKIDWAAIVDEL